MRDVNMEDETNVDEESFSSLADLEDISTEDVQEIIKKFLKKYGHLDKIIDEDGMEIYKCPKTGKETILNIQGVKAGYILVPVRDLKPLKNRIADDENDNSASFEVHSGEVHDPEPTFVFCPSCQHVAYDLRICSYCSKVLRPNLRKFWILNKFPDEDEEPEEVGRPFVIRKPPETSENKEACSDMLVSTLLLSDKMEITATEQTLITEEETVSENLLSSTTYRINTSFKTGADATLTEETSEMDIDPPPTSQISPKDEMHYIVKTLLNENLPTNTLSVEQTSPMEVDNSLNLQFSLEVQALSKEESKDSLEVQTLLREKTSPKTENIVGTSFDTMLSSTVQHLSKEEASSRTENLAEASPKPKDSSEVQTLFKEEFSPKPENVTMEEISPSFREEPLSKTEDFSMDEESSFIDSGTPSSTKTSDPEDGSLTIEVKTSSKEKASSVEASYISSGAEDSLHIEAACESNISIKTEDATTSTKALPDTALLSKAESPFLCTAVNEPDSPIQVIYTTISAKPEPINEGASTSAQASYIEARTSFLDEVDNESDSSIKLEGVTSSTKSKAKLKRLLKSKISLRTPSLPNIEDFFHQSFELKEISSDEADDSENELLSIGSLTESETSQHEKGLFEATDKDLVESYREDLQDIAEYLQQFHVGSDKPSVETLLQPVDGRIPGITDMVSLINFGEDDLVNRPDSDAEEEADIEEVEKMLLLKYLERDSICIHGRDMCTLDEGEWVNDIIIDFYLKYLAENISKPGMKDMVQFFNVPFLRIWYKRLKEGRRLSTTRWSKGLDVFSKSFLVFPISRADHWYLVIVCYPTPYPETIEETEKVTSETIEISSDDDDAAGDEKTKALVADNTLKFRTLKKFPCICIFDSMKNTNYTATLSLIRSCLSLEWKLEKGTEMVFSDENLPSFIMKCPEQKNIFDCGIYLLQNAESFFKKPFELKKQMPDLREGWYPWDWSTSFKRNELQGLIWKLHKEQYKELYES